MTDETPFDAEPEDAEPILERSETGVRILISLLFFAIVHAVEVVLSVVVLFDLGFALLTRRRPSETVRRFARRVLAYTVEIVRYLTYNDDSPPFPFRELPGGENAGG